MKILVSALETSSNIHLKALTQYFNEDIELIGIFDKSLGEANYDISELAVMGFVDVIKKIPFFLKLKSEMVELARDVDKVLLMDNSGFNLPLAKAIKQKYPNKEIIYYILPQAWAWKKKRIPVIEQNCDTLLSILPFEKNHYSKDTNIEYVGHPLLDEIPTFKNQLTTSGKVVFMPGSRKGEITSLMPIYNTIAKKIGKQAVLVIPKHFSKEFITEVYGDTSHFVISRDTYGALEEAEFAFICSGTATLEASLMGTPFILTYIAKPLDYFILKNMIKMPYIGLANIFFDKMGKMPMHKEFVQDGVQEFEIIQAYNNIDRELFLEKSKELRKYLNHGSSQRVAQIIQGS
jgi:lipid-A-disaccharide synthase